MGQFKPGDVVNLKSNHLHKMTIEKENPDTTYLCVWQDAKTKKKMSDDYAEVLLEKWVSKAGTIRLR